MFALTPKGQNIHQFKSKKYLQNGLYLLMGIEGPGLSKINFPPEKCLAIPMKPEVESLNAAAAAAIAMAMITAQNFAKTDTSPSTEDLLEVSPVEF
jgi:tRNA G18 (ribose-2'-O)-methylase SpoU